MLEMVVEGKLVVVVETVDLYWGVISFLPELVFPMVGVLVVLLAQGLVVPEPMVQISFSACLWVGLGVEVVWVDPPVCNYRGMEVGVVGPVGVVVVRVLILTRRQDPDKVVRVVLESVTYILIKGKLLCHFL
jgi:hypothetical protein